MTTGGRAGEGTERKLPRCPNCGRPRDARYRPFCSAACRDRDLLRWLKGDYAIPVVETEPDEDEGEHGPGPGRDE